MVAALDASCNTPLGVLRPWSGRAACSIHAFCGLPDGSEWLRDELEEDDSDPEASAVPGGADGGRRGRGHPGEAEEMGPG